MKLLTFDIETSPHLSFHWRRWQENIPKGNTIDESHTLCVAAKWYGKKKVFFKSEWQHGHTAMIEMIWNLLDEADAVIGFNSNKFDIKKLNSEFLRLGLGQPSPYAKIDLFMQTKKHFNFSSNRLKDLLIELGLSPKLEENANMQLWIDVVYNKTRESRKRMKEYNIQDVRSTEEFYEFLLGWIDPHPNWGLYVNDNSSKPVCPNCGSTHIHKHKKRYTKVNAYMQYKCVDCGKYSRGRRSLTKLKDNEGILA